MRMTSTSATTMKNNLLVPSVEERGLVSNIPYENFTFSLPTPDGDATIFIVEDEAGKIIRVDITIGKAGSSVAAWCNGFSRMLTFAINQGVALDAVIEELSDIASDRFQFSDGVPIRSGPEAMAIAFKKYRALKKL